MRGRAVTAVLAALGVLAPGAVAANGPGTGVAFEPQPLSEPRYGQSERYDHTVDVPAKDGEPIRVTTFLPQPRDGRVPPERLPTVLVMTPYESLTSRLLNAGMSQHALVSDLVERGYAVSFGHTRGTSRSGGCRDWWGPREIDAAARVIEYLGRDAPWASGKVAMYGISDDGGSQTGVATLGDPERTKYLKTIVPLAPDASAYDLWNFDGVPYHAVDAAIPLIGTALYEPPPDAPPDVDHVVCAADQARRGGDLTGDFTDWYAAREHRAHVNRVEIPVLLGHGLADTNVHPTMLAGLADRLPEGSKVVLGQWDHTYPDMPNAFSGGDYHREDWRAMVIAWYDRWLMDLPTGVEEWPEVQVQDTERQWRAEAAWPTTNGPAGQLALTRAGSLGAVQPEGSSSYREESTTWATGGAVFQTPLLEGPLRITGQPVLDLWVVLEKPDAHIGAMLEVVDALGRGEPTAESAVIGRPQLRGMRSARHLEPFVEGRFEQRDPVPPPVGSPVRVPIRFTPMDVIVPAGHRLRLTLAGQADLWAGPFPQAGIPSGVSQQVRIVHDCAHTSMLRFLMPSPDARLLNVREAGEDGPLPSSEGEPLAGDGGGLATAPVCEQGPSGARGGRR